MINGEKVILMTRASVYETRTGKQKLKIARYFRHDYISLQMLYGWFSVTAAFVLCVCLWGVCNMEYLLDNLHKMDLKGFGLKLFWLYLAVAAAYLCIMYGVSAYRYHTAKKSVGSYAHILRKISAIYAQEEKSAAPGTLMEERRHDSFT